MKSLGYYEVRMIQLGSSRVLIWPALETSFASFFQGESRKNSSPASNLTPLKSQWLLVLLTSTGLERSHHLEALQMVPKSNLESNVWLTPFIPSACFKVQFPRLCSFLSFLGLQDMLGSNFNKLNFPDIWVAKSARRKEIIKGAVYSPDIGWTNSV